MTFVCVEREVFKSIFIFVLFWGNQVVFAGDTDFFTVGLVSGSLRIVLPPRPRLSDDQLMELIKKTRGLPPHRSEVEYDEAGLLKLAIERKILPQSTQIFGENENGKMILFRDEPPATSVEEAIARSDLSLISPLFRVPVSAFANSQKRLTIYFVRGNINTVVLDEFDRPRPLRIPNSAAIAAENGNIKIVIVTGGMTAHRKFLKFVNQSNLTILGSATIPHSLKVCAQALEVTPAVPPAAESAPASAQPTPGAD